MWKKWLILLCLGSTLPGCVRYAWQSPYKSQPELAQDTHRCTLEARSLYPPQMRDYVAEEGYYTPIVTECYERRPGEFYGSEFGNWEYLERDRRSRYGRRVQTCETNPSRYVPPVVRTVDLNRNARDRAFSQCMQANSWEWKPLPDQ